MEGTVKMDLSQIFFVRMECRHTTTIFFMMNSKYKAERKKERKKENLSTKSAQKN